MPAKSIPCSVVPDGEKRAVGRRPNADYRKREHLIETEIEKLIEAAKTNRHGHRDSISWWAYRHALLWLIGIPLPIIIILAMHH